MAYQTFGPAWIPPLWTPTLTSNVTIDAAGEMCALVTLAPRSGDISGIAFYTSTVTTGDTIKGSLQNVSLTTGDPDESADQSGTVAVADSDDNVRKTITFGTPRTVVAGDEIAIVLEFNSYVAGNLQIRNASASTGAPMGRFTNVYTSSKLSGTWTKSQNMLLVDLNYGGTYYPAVDHFITGNNIVAFNTGSNPDEYALRFNSPVPVKVIGMACLVDLDNAADLILYDSDGTTPLATRSFDSDIRSQGAGGYHLTYFPEVTLAANTTYRAALKPTTGSSVTLQYVDVSSAAFLAQLGCGTSCYMSTRADAGSWTDVTTQRPGIHLLASAFDDGAGGGGGGGPLVDGRLVR